MAPPRGAKKPPAPGLSDPAELAARVRAVEEAAQRLQELELAQHKQDKGVLRGSPALAAFRSSPSRHKVLEFTTHGAACDLVFHDDAHLTNADPDELHAGGPSLNNFALSGLCLQGRTVIADKLFVKRSEGDLEETLLRAFVVSLAAARGALCAPPRFVYQATTHVYMGFDKIAGVRTDQYLRWRQETGGSPEALKALAVVMVEAYRSLHECRVCQRDAKPMNELLTVTDGRVVLRVVDADRIVDRGEAFRQHLCTITHRSAADVTCDAGGGGGMAWSVSVTLGAAAGLRPAKELDVPGVLQLGYDEDSVQAGLEGLHALCVMLRRAEPVFPAPRPSWAALAHRAERLFNDDAARDNAMQALAAELQAAAAARVAAKDDSLDEAFGFDAHVDALELERDSAEAKAAALQAELEALEAKGTERQARTNATKSRDAGVTTYEWQDGDTKYVLSVWENTAEISIGTEAAKPVEFGAGADRAWTYAMGKALDAGTKLHVHLGGLRERNKTKNKEFMSAKYAYWRA